MSASAIQETSFAKGCFIRDVPKLNDAITSLTTIKINHLAQIIVGYMTTQHNPIGAEQWRKIGVNVASEPEFKEGFEDWWCGPDPVDPSKRVYETHIPPVLRLPDSSLQSLIQMGLQFKSELLEAYEHEHIKIENPCWLTMRKGVLASGDSFGGGQQCIEDLNANGAGYEEKPSSIDLATVVFARYKFNGERHLGDSTGEERRITSSRCFFNDECFVIGPFSLTGILFKITSVRKGSLRGKRGQGIVALRRA
jgi:hypothetical protein